MSRKFYKTTITVEVLSEEPTNFSTLQDVHNAITTGDCSGKWNDNKVETVDGPTMVRLLEEQGSDPCFFQLDADGNYIGEGEEENTTEGVCRECSSPARIDEHGISNHLTKEREIDYDKDADHVAILDVEED